VTYGAGWLNLINPVACAMRRNRARITYGVGGPPRKNARAYGSARSEIVRVALQVLSGVTEYVRFRTSQGRTLSTSIPGSRSPQDAAVVLFCILLKFHPLDMVSPNCDDEGEREPASARCRNGGSTRQSRRSSQGWTPPPKTSHHRRASRARVQFVRI